MNDKIISIVIPFFNELDSLKDLLVELKNMVTTTKINYEIIFIDDGSWDGSFEYVLNKSKVDNNIKIIKLKKNYGKSYALTSGFKFASGDYIITMDADLQDNPNEIIKLINELEKGWGLVCGWKKRRQDPLSKRIPSKIYNFILKLFFQINVNDFNTGLKGYQKSLAKSIDLYGGLHRFVPILSKSLGYSINEIEVNHRPRLYGKSKYGISRLFHGFFDFISILLLNKFLHRPMHFFGFIGLLFFLIGGLINAYLLYGWLNGIYINNRPIFFISILFIILGTQFFSLGLIGDLIVKGAKTSKNIISEKINL